MIVGLETADDDMDGLADRIANLTLKEAVQLSKCLKDVHGIAPTIFQTWPDVDFTKQLPNLEQTEFDVVLEGFNDAKLAVVKEVKAITAATLMTAKKMVESCPVKIKEKVCREEAERIQNQLQVAGATVSIR